MYPKVVHCGPSLNWPGVAGELVPGVAGEVRTWGYFSDITCPCWQAGSLARRERSVRSDSAILPDLRQMEANLTHDFTSSWRDKAGFV